MVSLDVVVFNVLANGGIEMTFAEWNNMAKTFVFDRAHKSFGKCVQIGTVAGSLTSLTPAASQQCLN